MDQLPTFLIIGAQKSATSWLHHQLAQHPQVFMSRKKELGFFLGNGMPVAQYRSHFREARPDQQRGESTPMYLDRPQAPLEIQQLLPQAKLICILRDPADRAFSQWRMARELGTLGAGVSMIDAFRQDQRLIRSRGEYIVHLENYGRVFPPERIAIFLYDDLARDPRTVWRAALNFLEVDAAFEPDGLADRVGASDPGETLDRSDRAEMVAHYEPFNRRLELRLGRDLSAWRR